MHAFNKKKTEVFILQGLACMLRILFGPLNFYLAIFFRVFYFYGCLSLQLVGLLNIIARLLIVRQVKLLHLTFCQDRTDSRRGERFTYWKKNYLHRKSYTTKRTPENFRPGSWCRRTSTCLWRNLPGYL
jgi:hypothetical protein